MINQDAYNYYQRQKEVVDSWMQYDYIQKLYDNLRTVVKAISKQIKNTRLLTNLNTLNNLTNVC